MRLSEAIRMGSLLHRQGFGHGFDGQTTCASGAALVAIGITTQWRLSSDRLVPEEWRTIRAAATVCPVEGCDLHTIHSALCYTLAHLNDAHRWTRERIADWVECVERTENVRRVETAKLAQGEPIGIVGVV